MKGSRNDGAPVRPEINVTPLVDVMLVLLIIFMVVGPHLQQDRPVQLASARDPAPRADAPGQIIVVVDADKHIWVGRQRIEAPDFRTWLTQELARRPDQAVLVKADRRLSVGDVKPILLDVRAAGGGRIGLVAARLERP